MLIQERIDRFFVNPSWCVMYPDAKVVHLTRCHSNHCPVLLEMQPREANRRERPFMFQTCWLSDITFPKVISQAWSHVPRLGEAIENFTKEAKVWKRT